MQDSISSPKVHIASGLFEPVYLTKLTTDIIVNVMKEMVQNCKNESIGVQRTYSKQTKTISEALKAQ